MSHYLKVCFGSVLAALALVALFNALVDPWGVLSMPALEGLTGPKSAAIDHTRLMKAHAVRWRQPAGVVLGASSAIFGLDPNHEAWPVSPVYNLALPGANLFEIRRYLEHAQSVHPLRLAVLAVDFFSFNVHAPDGVDFDPHRLLGPGEAGRLAGRPFEPLWLLFSVDTLEASIRTLRQNLADEPGPVGLANGLFAWRREPDWIDRLGGYAELFSFFEKGFMGSHWFPPPRHVFSLEDSASGRSSFAELQAILDLARREGIDLRLMISPSHARLEIAQTAIGLGPRFDRWRRTLVRLLEEDGARSGAAAFPLWAFDGFNSITTEPLPDSSARNAVMRWYTDPPHFRKEAGDLMLDRIFDYRAAGRDLPADFGVRLDSQSLAADFESRRAGERAYRAAHVDEVARIEASARKIRVRFDARGR